MPGLFETPQVPRLPTLLTEVRNGAILIPDFQRPLEWNDDRRLILLDSVAKQMPIGAFLVWRTRQHSLRCLDTLGAFRLPQGPGDQVPRAYLLDGHQRLATLFAALSWTEDPGPLHRQGMRWPVYYDLEAEAGDQPFRFHGRAGDPPLTWLPLYALLDPKRLYDHQKRLLDARQDAAATAAEILAERFKDYQIPVVPLVSEDLSLVTDSFVRVNTQGKSMSEMHMLRALAYAPERDIARELDTVKAELATLGWGGIDDQLLLNVLKAHWRLNVLDTQPQTLYKRLEKDGYAPILDVLRLSVRWAIEVLATLGVRGPRALPYANQLIALADAAWHLEQPQLNPDQAERVRRWFWATTYGEYFTAMSGRRIRDAINDLREIITEGRDPVPSDLNRLVAPIRLFNFRATRTKALMLLMTEKIDDPVVREQTQRLLGELGNEAVQKLFSAADSTRPENRLVALPDELERLQRDLGPPGPSIALELPGHGRTKSISDDFQAALKSERGLLLGRYLVPEDASELFQNESSLQYHAILETTLRGRRAKLDALERDFLTDLGIELSQGEDE